MHSPFSSSMRRLAVSTLSAAVLVALFPSFVHVSGAKMPKNFTAQWLNFVNPHRGWIMGEAACGKKTCTRVVRTTDGAKSWKTIGTIPAPIVSMGESDQPGVTEITFQSKLIGWAYGPWLYNTTNSGKTWTKVALPKGAKQVIALGTNSTNTYILTSKLKYASGIAPLHLWYTSSATGAAWTRIKMKLPPSDQGSISTLGNSVYIAEPVDEGGTDKLYASTDGTMFKKRKNPCDSTTDTTIENAVAWSSTDVGVLCDGDPGFSNSVKTAYRSTDNGETFTSAGTMGQPGIQCNLAVSPSGKMAVESWSDGSFIYVNNNGKTKWLMPVAKSDGGAGWSSIDYVKKKTAWIVYGPASFPSEIGQVFETTDAGITWNQVSL
jgi:photosystem II stability/assembly factor-like uncharacterized protein